MLRRIDQSVILWRLRRAMNVGIVAEQPGNC